MSSPSSTTVICPSQSELCSGDSRRDLRSHCIINLLSSRSKSQNLMDTLPDELLSMVFTWTMHAARTEDRYEAIVAVIYLSHVCSRWRSVALTTSALWTGIILTYPTSDEQQERSRTWIRRSRTAPVDIYLDVRDPTWDMDEYNHDVGHDEMIEILSIIGLAVHRWRSLTILADTWEPLHTFLTATERWHPRKLESLMLWRCNEYLASKGQLFEPAALRAPVPLFGGRRLNGLCDVHLNGVHVDWTQSPLHDLTSLEFRHHASDVMPSLREFVTILGQCPKLTNLTILGWGPRLPKKLLEHPVSAATKPVLFLPGVTDFSFGFVDTEYALAFLALLALPALQTLSLTDVGGRIYDPQDSGPVLDFLVARQTWLSSSSSSPLSVSLSACPSGCRCSSAPHAGACRGNTAASPFPLANLLSLDLHDTYAATTHFARFFDELPALRRLTLIDVDTNALHALRPHGIAFPDPAHVILRAPCPRLAILSCRRVREKTLYETISARRCVPTSTIATTVYFNDALLDLDSFVPRDE